MVSATAHLVHMDLPSVIPKGENLELVEKWKPLLSVLSSVAGGPGTSADRLGACVGRCPQRMQGTRIASICT